MSGRIKTREDYDNALDAIDDAINKHQSDINKLQSQWESLHKKKLVKFDPDYRKEQAELRKASAERKKLIDDAKKKFIGKWLSIDDGTYIHVAEVEAPTRKDVTNTSLCPGQLVFPTRYDIKIEIGEGEARIRMTNVKASVVYLTLYADDVIKTSKKDVMEDLSANVADINNTYQALCKKLKWKPAKVAKH